MPLRVDDFKHALSLRGSPRRDAFKHAHKAKLGPGFWASDLDLVLIRKAPPGIVAILDCKQPGEPLSFAEVIAYNALMRLVPIFVVEARDAETGPFRVLAYHGGDWRPSPPIVRLEPVADCADWAALGEWESALRRGTTR